MTLKRTALVALFGALACGATVSAASAHPMSHHPRQAEVLGRAAHQRTEIRHEARAGAISHAKAHRLLVANRRIVAREHRMAHANGGYLTKAQVHRLNHRETRLAHRMHG